MTMDENMDDILPEQPKDLRGPNESPERKTEKVQQTAHALATAVTEQFSLCSHLSAIDLNTLAAMNKSVEAFHAALQERVGTLLTSAHSAQRHADASRPLAHQMTSLLQKARQLEAIIDRLDEYTSKQETSLLNNRGHNMYHRHNNTTASSAPTPPK